MRFARGDMRDHIISHRNDHGASYGRYAVLQWWSRLKISFCEIFGVVQFSTFSTLSARSRHQEGAGIRPRSETANAISSKPASENQIIAYHMCWLRECERCRTSPSRSCNALDRRRQGAPGPLVFINETLQIRCLLMSDIPSTAARSRTSPDVRVGSRLCVARRPRHEDNDRSVRSRNGPGVV